MIKQLLEKKTVSTYHDAFLTLNSPLEFIEQCGELLKKTSKMGDEHGVGVILLGQGYCHLWICDYKKAIEYLFRSVDILEKYNDISGLLLAKMGISQGYIYLGEFDRVDKINNELEKSVINTHDFVGKCLVRLNIAEYHLKRGDSVLAKKYAFQVYEDSRKKEMWYPYTLSCLSLGYYHLEIGDTLSAKKYFEKAIPLIERDKMFPQFTLYGYYLLFEAIWIENPTIVEELDHSEKKKYLDRMKYLCERAFENSVKWPSHFGPTLRIKGLYHAILNNHKRAEFYFDKAISHNSTLGRRYDLGRTFYFYFLFLNQIGKTREAGEKLKSAHRIFKEIGSQIYVQRTAELLGSKDPRKLEMILEGCTPTNTSAPGNVKIDSLKDLEVSLKTALDRIVRETGSERGGVSVENKQKKVRLKYFYNLKNKDIMHKLKKNNSDTDVEFLYKEQVVGEAGTIFWCYFDKAMSGYLYTSGIRLVFDSLFMQTAITVENFMLNSKLNERKKNQHPVTEATRRKINSTVSYIEENYSTEISRENLAIRFEINADNLGRFFKMKTGMGIMEYANMIRVKEAKRLLQYTDKKIIDIAFETGFSSLSTFNRFFIKNAGMTPSKYRLKPPEI